MRQVFICLAIPALVVSTGAISALAHSLDETDDGSIPPPLMIEMREAEALAKDLGASANATRGGINQFKLWASGQTLKACFFDGEDRVKEYFITTSKVWTTGTSLAIDFGVAPQYTVCDPQKPSDIRISFARSGSWSYVGTDSLRYDLNGPSLNVDYPQRGAWESLDKNELAHLILHELGHALALEHEHQNPKENCGTEFDWDKVYPYFETRLHWTKQEIDFNMRTKLNEPRIRWTPYDKQSIMHYYFAPWMFKKGTASSCYVGNNLRPSAVDLSMIWTAYPLVVASQDGHLQDQADRFSSVLASLKLTVAQLSHIAQEVKTALEGFKRPVSLQFDLEKGTTRGPGAPIPALNDCGAGASSAGNVTCQVANDASGFVLNVTPKP